ncbi:MAG: flagella basal body P-ring formation protein FlgA [Gammaproteobacteria bacterium]|nr:flagellar basal body P-ring formation protein FlgA [Gammaproteobacteria bacterium]PCH62667.1 MAG: flagella basal body P-ring formation protein FlgA [Gammaproteobacteria bacterium]
MNQQRTPHYTQLSILAVTLIMPLGAYSANPLQSHESIEKAVHQHILTQIDGENANIEVELNQIDSRLSLQQCDQPLQTEVRGVGELRGRIAIAVKCSSPKAWKFYLGATVRQFGNIVVAKQGIPRGTVLSIPDVRLDYTELSQLRQGYYQNINDVVGMVAKRTLSADKAISPNAVNRKQLVNRGDKVTIRAILSGVEVRMVGEALADGANGERISVKNLNSNRIINAVVTSNGIVTVTL